MVVARDISAAQPDFDPNAPVTTWLYHERVWQQWEVRQWRFFSLVFHTDREGGDEAFTIAMRNVARFNPRPP